MKFSLGQNNSQRSVKKFDLTGFNGLLAVKICCFSLRPVRIKVLLETTYHYANFWVNSTITDTEMWNKCSFNG